MQKNKFALKYEGFAYYFIGRCAETFERLGNTGLQRRGFKFRFFIEWSIAWTRLFFRQNDCFT